jgi:hypothetical protein
MTATREEVSHRCSACIVTAEAASGGFDENGMCGECRRYQSQVTLLGEEAFAQELASLPRTGSYDCVVPLSGGKDSTYILYYVVRKLGLRPVAVNFDGGYQVEIARQNCIEACRILKTPLYFMAVQPSMRRAVLREALRMSVVDGNRFCTCGDCESMLRLSAIRIARKHNVPFVLWGSSPLESTSAAVVRHGKSMLKASILRLLRAMTSRHKLPRLLRAAPHLLRLALLQMSQKHLMGAPWSNVIRPFKILPFTKENPRFVFFYDYVSWDSIAHADLLKRELNWRHPPDHDIRFDCQLHAFGNFERLRYYGITGDGLALCRYVREGKLSREEALRRERRLLETVIPECREILHDLGVTPRGDGVW